MWGEGQKGDGEDQSVGNADGRIGGGGARADEEADGDREGRHDENHGVEQTDLLPGIDPPHRVNGRGGGERRAENEAGEGEDAEKLPRVDPDGRDRGIEEEEEGPLVALPDDARGREGGNEEEDATEERCGEDEERPT